MRDIPEGWKLVPEEPTDKMNIAGGFSFAGRVPNSLVFQEVLKVWRAMLAAAPTPPPTQVTDALVERVSRAFARAAFDEALEGDAESEWDRITPAGRAALGASHDE